MLTLLAAAGFQFDAAWIVLPSLALAAVLLFLSHRNLRKQEFPASRAWILTSLRTLTFLTLIFLAAQPVWVIDESQANRKSIIVLLDRSESMGFKDDQKSTRYEKALGFLKEQLAPAVKKENWGGKVLLFAEDVADADATTLAQAKPDGKRTDLGLAVARGMTTTSVPPLAIIALTDGVSTENSSNGSAIAAMVESGVPFFGIGFGNDQGMASLTLRGIDAPTVVPPNRSFAVSIRVEAVTSGAMPEFELLLLRDGKLYSSRKVKTFEGSRFWNESFAVTESEVGMHRYSVQMLTPKVTDLITRNTLETAQVRVTGEKDFRILFVQGALSWDYKFINRAVSDDPSIRITGLSRTSKRSVFRQNLEAAGELEDGFPKTLEEMAPYRVVVLSGIRSSEMNEQQQEVLARFCGELGGGVLMIGGPSTFDSSWLDSRLESLLPVTFEPDGGVLGLDQAFHLQLTDEALASPVFQIDEPSKNREAWKKVPAFVDYGRVHDVKPGARVLAVHERDMGPEGRRILMASQYYGSGITAVMCLQNMWRWRLDKESNPAHFDRFWKQFLRYLGEGGRQDLSMQLDEQELRPDRDIQFTVERRTTPAEALKGDAADPRKYKVEVAIENKPPILNSEIELDHGNSIGLAFHPHEEGLYQITVKDNTGASVLQRVVEVRNVNVELERTARDMENLRQWSALTKGTAIPFESVGNTQEMMEKIRAQIELAKSARRYRWPIGINGWVLLLLMCSLCGEWGLRRHWRLP